MLRHENGVDDLSLLSLSGVKNSYGMVYTLFTLNGKGMK